MTTRFRGVLVLLAGLLAAGPAIAHAQGEAPPQLPLTVDTAGGQVTILADHLEQVGADNLLVATGNVEITRGATRLLADRVEINRTTGDAVAQGQVIFYDGEDRITAERLDYNLKTGTGVVYEGKARAAPFYRLDGERMERLGESLYHVRKGIFTTCEDDPPAWSFHLGSATADLNDYLYGTQASFWVKDIPLIPFIPFFAAAIRRERQTGFLFPKFGSTSSKGFFAEIPFYWAISDSQDATIAPIMYERRGYGFDGEYRYVLSNDQRGRLQGFLLDETQRHGSLRGLGGFRHQWQLSSGLSVKADVNMVTDDDVLREYGDRIQQIATQRLESNVFVTRRWESWNFVGDLFWYQDLTTKLPTELQRLPDLSLQAVRQPVSGIPGLLYEADTSYVHFERVVGSEGDRLDLHPRLSRPFSPGGIVTVTPFVGGRLTAYDKTVTGTHLAHLGQVVVESTNDDPRLRRLAEGGTDVETTLTRVYPMSGWWNLDSVLHSIEPRVNYTWITGEDKTKLPDWTEGVDRIGETSLVTYSLTNRVRAKTTAVADTQARPDVPERPESKAFDWEALRFVVGNSFDLKTQTTRDILGSLIVQPNGHLSVRSDISHGTHGEGIQLWSSSVGVSILPVSASVGYSYSDPSKINYVGTTLAADIARWLTLRGSTNWDIHGDTFVESRVGAEFHFQCWALVAEFVHRPNHEDEFRFALNLLGVAGPIATSVGVGALEPTGQK